MTAVFDDADIDLLTGAQLPAHVYVHIPFCASKCSYCDFYSLAGADANVVGAVTESIRSELRRWGSSALGGLVETLYIGGGTPTCVAESTLRILEQATGNLPLREGAEITVEANPESLSAELARELRSAGVTRLSLGIQSFDDGVLRLLGRPHDAQAAQIASAAAVDAGLELAVDLMCGIPGQTMSSWQETLDHAVRTGARHVSVYPLSLEAGTPLGVACDAGLVAEPDPDLAADMMILAEDVLAGAGLVRYEVANYARPGFESRHNVSYWTGRSYVGIGPSAHSMFDRATAVAMGLEGMASCPPGTQDVSEGGRIRYAQPSDVQGWLFGADQDVEVLSAEEAEREDVMLGMRLSAGVGVDRVRSAGLGDVFAGFEREGLVEQAASSPDATHRGTSGAVFRTTRRGWLLGNEVFGRIWLAK